ncbi:IPT/TIG domain-containing protein [Chryseolinea lacunae]|uniref:IPT/TIG domain-containing protein n=1 Tax=Chryseolinea lacunae TaxID=2801331 RepID=A0ABS1KVH8_9BACT|nr:IPT/TIG domain-containing protein [Chryseolinea lacunae]MBL0743474.1 IPT/TIG domain-containing protein [Chryseolinea lacunae]
MKTLFKISVILLVSLAFVKCDKNDFPTPPYPTVQTLEVTGISENGVTFEGAVRSMNDEPIIDHGFVWGLYQYAIEGQFKTSLGPRDGAGAFTLDVSSGLYADTLYYVKAYLKTKTYTVYGEEQPFTSRGSHVPVIESFLPLEGTGGDTVVIKGNYFSTDAKAVKVKFGTFEAPVLSSSLTEVKCRVPADIPLDEVAIVVTVTRQSVQAPTLFKLETPVVETFSPQTGTFGDVVTLQGKHFDVVKEKNIVKFNDVIATVIDATPTVIKVGVPAGLRTRESRISISVGLQSSLAQGNFTLNAPIIQSLSSTSDYTGKTLSIAGSNFNPERAANVVLLGGLEVTVQNASKTLLVVDIPAKEIYDARSFKVEVRVAEQNAFSAQTFTLKDAWLRRANVPIGDTFGPYSMVNFTLAGKGYIGMGDPNATKAFWRYTPQTNTWTQVTNYPGTTKTGATAFTVGDKAYVGLGSAKEFYSYEPLANQWTKLGDFPGSRASTPIGFSGINKGYVALGNATSNFWEYDPAVDKWTLKATLPASGYFAGFTINNTPYAYRLGTTSFLQYDVANDAWISKAGETTSADYSSGYAFKGKGYLRTQKQVFQYDPSSDGWQTIDDATHGVGGGYFAFEIDGRLYLGSTMGREMWEYDPAYD